ncbi:MAG: TIGR01777 family protein [Oscillatoriales cyanobacterium RM2_1_1]|nr:TIGR01777 family protein [Oscillatoriales cyanobacterium RM2_1_1]
MKIAITGATGFVGSRLVERLNLESSQVEGHQVLVLTRSPERAQRIFPASAYPRVEIMGYTPTESGEWQRAIAGCDGVVNLAGAAITDERWTPQRKQEILNSRVKTTEKLVKAIDQAEPRPRVLVNASAIGYYGTSETATFDEASHPGDDFLAQVCQAWEATAAQVKAGGTRLVVLRFGIVLGDGGALEKMLTPFRLFAGGPLGTGKQWFSWVHREDVVNLILFSLQHPEVEGVLNATAPDPVRMAEFCQTLGQVLNRPSWLPVPGFALEVLLGDSAKLVLEGQQVLPKRTLAANFDYQYPKLEPALREILQGN